MRKEYLDGLRGWASLFVVFSHLGPMFLLSTQKLPILPFFADGLLAVYIFFVLSGCVLSVGFLERQDQSILVALAVRRYPRLTLPILASCSIAMIMVQVGAMLNVPAGNLAKSPWLASFYTFPVSLDSLLHFTLADVYVDAKAPSYNAVLWTMQYEFWGSLILLASLWGLRSRTLRIVGYMAASAVCCYHSSPLFAFVLGVALADATPQIRARIAKSPRLFGWTSWALLGIALLTGMLRSGVMWSPIALSLVAAAILASVLTSRTMQQLLSSQLSAFLGRISFPLYLTHLLVICSWSSWFYLQLRQSGIPMWSVGGATAASTVAISILAATAFEPIEKGAIRLSRALSDALLGRTAATKVRAKYDH